MAPALKIWVAKASPTPVGRLPAALPAATALLVVTGTLATGTGTGPHAGDSSGVRACR
ncbi:hypothetical protein ACWGH8_19780 [Nonomuraea muscovyensis]